MPFCSSCGQKIETADKYCNSCGQAAVNSSHSGVKKPIMKYVGLLAGLLFFPVYGALAKGSPWFMWVLSVPAGLIGFAIGAIIDQLDGRHSAGSPGDAAGPREERKCPHCSESILKDARVCKHCGRSVEPLKASDLHVQTRADPPHPAASAGAAMLALPDQRQGAWEGASAGRILAPAAKPSSFRAAPDPADRMQLLVTILVSGLLIVGGIWVGGAWYFSQNASKAAVPQSSSPSVQQSPSAAVQHLSPAVPADVDRDLYYEKAEMLSTIEAEIQDYQRELMDNSPDYHGEYHAELRRYIADGTELKNALENSRIGQASDRTWHIQVKGWTDDCKRGQPDVWYNWK